MSHMDMDQIQTFVAIARGGSFGHAARALHRSQPAISRRVELLEQECGVSLFDRLRGGARLTDAGEALLPYAEAMLAAAKDGAEAVRAVKQGTEGVISLALVGTLANSTFTDVLRGFRGRHPRVRLSLQTATSQEVSDLVRRGEATFGLRYLDDGSSDLIASTVARERLLVACSAKHHLASGRRHRPVALAGEQWVAFHARRSRESFVQFLQSRLVAAGIEEPQIIPIDSLTAQKRLVEASFGVALLAESAIEEELRLGTLRVIDVPALRASIPVTLVHRRRGYLGAAARTLLSEIATIGGRENLGQRRSTR